MIVWFCHPYDRAINNKIISKHIRSISHQQNIKFSAVVKEYPLDKPNVNKIYSIISDCCRYCYNSHFHTFKLKCKYNIEMTSGEFNNEMVFDRKLKKNFEENGFIHKVTIKIYSNLSYINTH